MGWVRRPRPRPHCHRHRRPPRLRLVPRPRGRRELYGRLRAQPRPWLFRPSARRVVAPVGCGASVRDRGAPCRARAVHRAVRTLHLAHVPPRHRHRRSARRLVGGGRIHPVAGLRRHHRNVGAAGRAARLRLAWCRALLGPRAGLTGHAMVGGRRPVRRVSAILEIHRDPDDRRRLPLPSRDPRPALVRPPPTLPRGGPGARRIFAGHRLERHPPLGLLRLPGRPRGWLALPPVATLRRAGRRGAVRAAVDLGGDDAGGVPRPHPARNGAPTSPAKSGRGEGSIR